MTCAFAFGLKLPMPKIRVLPEELKNKIAAGEVVERPASVVKELLENSIDAASTAVTVEVLYGGRKLIRVSDNGSGMDREDALLSIERHATSKLQSEEDLFDIRTMGFRGEALPSIASVSRLRIVTAPEGSREGVSVEAEGGAVKEVRDSPALGTTVEVRDIFFNTPARKKFLKRDSTELTHIIEAITRLALSHPSIGFTLLSDGSETMGLPRASGLRERLLQVYGGEFVDGLVEFEKRDGTLGLHAFCAGAQNLRDTRAHQLVFINSRPVKEPSVSHALYSAYEGAIPRGKHPPYFVFIEMDPARVDFNVHPTKREVRFEDKDAVYRFVRRAAMEALRPPRPAAGGPSAYTRGAVETGDIADAAHVGAHGTPPASGPAMTVSESLPLAYRAELPHVYLGEAFVALSRRGGGLMLLDHHAAHERILYERLLKGLRLQSGRLLFPRQVRLSPREYMVVLENREMLSEFGMEIEDFGRDTVVVRSLPEAMREADLRGILSDAAGQIIEGARPGQPLREAVAARIACHGSVRGSQVLSSDELWALLRDLDEAEDPDHCPHGRPTRVLFSLEDLQKLFKRK